MLDTVPRSWLRALSFTIGLLGVGLAVAPETYAPGPD
jgi:hypothetical protein